jgi:hypothetical protein
MWLPKPTYLPKNSWELRSVGSETPVKRGRGRPKNFVGRARIIATMIEVTPGAKCQKDAIAEVMDRTGYSRKAVYAALARLKTLIPK